MRQESSKDSLGNIEFTPDSVRRIKWGMRQEARCHDRMLGLTPDLLGIVFLEFPRIECSKRAVAGVRIYATPDEFHADVQVLWAYQPCQN